MKSKKISIIMITITVLLTVTIIGLIANAVTVNVAKKSSIYEIASNVDNLNNLVSGNVTQDTESQTQYNEVQSADMQNIQELRTDAINEGEISSRSEVDRQEALNTEVEEEIYINTGSTEETEYEEVIQYTKIEDIQISFDMDVSKTTGLSKEDFVYLVQNMKYDKTGILAKNAEWIWECCQTYSVNEIFVLGICGIESGWCSAKQHQNTHNYSSLMKGGKLIPYSSDEEGFEAMIKLLGQKYLTPGASLYHGATITGVGQCYCNPTTWPKKVYTCMQQVLQ